MGDLHEGHLSLVRRAKKENDLVEVSIYVNPIQFNQKRDFLKYRRDEKKDVRLLKKEGVDCLFIPDSKEIYPPGYQTYVSVRELAKELCGAHRPCHFDGVATVVLQLLHLVNPARCYMGQKDYQQCRLVEQLCADLKMDVRIVSCPTVREPSGLALSSRNSRLTEDERRRAGSIFRALQVCAQMIKFKPAATLGQIRSAFDSQLELTETDRVEYFAMSDLQTLRPLARLKPRMLLACAVWLGQTRLIDNLLIRKK